MRAFAPALLLALAGAAGAGPAAGERRPAAGERRPAAERSADRIIAVGIASRAPAVSFRPFGSFQVIDQSTGS